MFSVFEQIKTIKSRANIRFDEWSHVKKQFV